MSAYPWGCAVALASALATMALLIAPAYRNALLNSDDERPEVTRVFSGKPARGLRNRYMDALRSHEDELLPFPAQYSVFGVLRAHATAQDDGEHLPMW